MSYLCKSLPFKTTFLQSNTWLLYLSKRYHVGKIYTSKLRGQYFEISTKIAGIGWIFPHAPYLASFKTSNDIYSEDLDRYIDKVVSAARQYNVDFIKIIPPFYDSLECSNFLKRRKALLSPKTYEYASWHAWLDLTKFSNLEQVLYSFRKSTRYLIKKSFGLLKVRFLNLVTTNSNYLKEIRQFWKGLTSYTSNKGIIPDWGSFKAMILSSLSINSDITFLPVTAELENKNVGYALFTVYRDTIFYHYSAFSKSFPKLGISHYVLYKAIEYALDRNFTYFSLWGSNIPSTKNYVKQWQGFSNFKLGFRPNLTKLIGPFIIPLTVRGRLAWLRDWLGDFKLRYLNS